MNSDEQDSKMWRTAILSILEGTSDELKIKKLRKQVLISLQQDDSDKAAKKTFKRTVQALEQSGELSLSASGLVSLRSGGRKRKLQAEDKRKTKRKRAKNPEEDAIEPNVHQQTAGEQSPVPDESNDKNKPCKGNPQGVTRLFLGNLPFAVDETSIGVFFKEEVTHIKWITDK